MSDRHDHDQHSDDRDQHDHHQDHDHHEENHNQATPGSNQSLILGIVLGAVVLLLLLLVISQQLGKSTPKEDDPLADLKAEVAAAKAKLKAERARSGIQPAQSVQSLSENIKSDTDALANLVSGMQGELRDLRDVKKSLSALSRDNDSLRTKLASSANARSQVAGLQSRLKNAESRLDALRQQLAAAPDPSVATDLKQTRAQLEDLRTQAEDLRAQSAGKVDGSRLVSLQKLVDQLQPENDGLRRDIQRLRAEVNRGELFVTRKNLSPRATALFRELVALEDNNPGELKSAYQRIDNDLNARVVDSINFPVGRADIAFKHVDKLEKTIADAPPNAFFLVVGYASSVGEKAANSDLSGKRATRVASMVNYRKKESQKVQAVYLGETDRFGPAPGPNQTCELWEIRP